MDMIQKTAIAAMGGVVSYLFGGWTVALTALIIFTGMDYLTGLFGAAKTKSIHSRVGLYGIARKMLIFVVVAMANIVDLILADFQVVESHMVRDAAILFYLVNEGISILENVGRAGLPIPDKLRNAFEILKDRGDK